MERVQASVARNILGPLRTRWALVTKILVLITRRLTISYVTEDTRVRDTTDTQFDDVINDSQLAL